MSFNRKLFELVDVVQRSAGTAGETASAVAYDVQKRANGLLSVARLKSRLAEKNREIDEALKSLGAQLYGTHIGEPSDSEALLDKLAEIDTLKAEALALEQEIGAEKSRQLPLTPRKVYAPACPVCGAGIHEGDQFCGACGTPLGGASDAPAAQDTAASAEDESSLFADTADTEEPSGEAEAPATADTAGAESDET